MTGVEKEEVFGDLERAGSIIQINCLQHILLKKILTIEIRGIYIHAVDLHVIIQASNNQTRKHV